MNTLIRGLSPVSAVCIYVARMVELRTRRQIIAGTIREKVTLRLFVSLGTAMLIGSMAEYWFFQKSFLWPFFVSGWAVALYSFYLRRQAIAALGPFWSLYVEIRENHQLVREGPFRWVRHPAYASMVLEMLALTLLLRAWCTAAIVSAIFLPTLYVRIWIEEKALIEKFGDAYRLYCRQVPAIFPYKGQCA